MSSIMKTKKRVAAILATLSLLCGLLGVAVLKQDTREPHSVGTDSLTKKSEQVENLRIDWFFTTYRRKKYDDAIRNIRDTISLNSNDLSKRLDYSGKLLLERFYSACKIDKYDDAIRYIRELIQLYEERNDAQTLNFLRNLRSFAYASLDDYDRTITDSEKDIEHDAKDSAAHYARVRALILKAYQTSSDIKSDSLTYALDELDKYAGSFARKDAVCSHKFAVLFRSFRDEYPIALRHANALVDMFPSSAKILEMRAECWEGMDKDFRNMRGHFERVGINIGDWRISNGKEKALEDWTSAIKIQDTVGRRIKRARLEAELFKFEDAWADLKIAKEMAKTDKDRDWVKLSIKSMTDREKEARELMGA